MDDNALKEIISVYKDFSESFLRVEKLLIEMNTTMNKTGDSIEEMNKHFKNGFRSEIINKITDNFNNTSSVCRVSYTKEFSLLFYKLVASSTIIVIILSFIVYIVSKGKIKIF